MTTHFRGLTDEPQHVHVVQRPCFDRHVASGKAAKLSGAHVYRNGGKRAFDLTLVLATLPFVLLVVALLAVCVAMRGGQPLYSQDRIGKNGRVYKIWKLRTMVVDADTHLETHLAADPAAKAEWVATQKLKVDPRITPFGRILRKSSLDELPQLWNVLRGDMSLIGPRPMMINQKNMYPGSGYYELRPGISGTWQVSARNESSFAERAIFDDSYNNNVTMANDLKILVQTVRVVMRATGH